MLDRNCNASSHFSRHQLPSFEEIKSESEACFSLTHRQGYSAKAAQKISARPVYKFAPAVPFALLTTSDERHLQFVFVDKEHFRSIVILEEDTWRSRGEVLITTEYPYDEDDGVAVDTFVCRFSKNNFVLDSADEHHLTSLASESRLAFELFLKSLPLVY